MSARRAGQFAAISAPVGVAVGVLVDLATAAPAAALIAGLAAATVLAALIARLPGRSGSATGAKVAQRAAATSAITQSGITVRGGAEVEQDALDTARVWRVAAKDDGEFIHRREALAAFENHEHSERVLVYWGMSGQGKSRLLRRLAELHGAVIIDLEWSTGEHLNLAFPLLDRIAAALSDWTGTPMRRFDRAREVAERELRAAHEAIPPVRQQAGTIIGVATEPAAAHAAEVRAQHCGTLAAALADDLRRARLDEHVLCFDTVERLRYVDGVATVADQQSWVLDELISGLLVAAPKLRVVLAAREPVVAELPTTEFELTDWAAADTADYLHSGGLAEPEMHEAVHSACGGLPGWIGTAADAVLVGERTGNPLTAREITDAALGRVSKSVRAIR